MTLNGKVALVTGASRGIGESESADLVTLASEAGRRILETAFRPMTEASWG
jgi:NAD(P)-dependent dehydrogenase (short-subunit alcohol dehydrogenase family)